VSVDRDLVIQTLADSEAELRAELAVLREERDTHRELLSVALEQLHKTTATLNRTRETVRLLLELERAQPAHQEASA
jgi:hypothetical protein